MDALSSFLDRNPGLSDDPKPDAPELLRFSLTVPDQKQRHDLVQRAILFAAWLALIGWFCSTHVFWRDEVRAFSLALSGNNVLDMLRNVHGEGHPALWYLILRGAHQLFPYREVLPAAAALIAIGAMAILTFTSPFRLFVIGLVLFSFYGAFEYVAMARNYGLSVLVMFAIAALYPRIRNTLVFGVLVALLCNTNVPACIIAAGFMLFRFVEMLTGASPPERRGWLAFGGNALLAVIGAYLCFRTVYPTFNDDAISPHLQHLNAMSLLKALADSEWGFSHLGFGGVLPLPLNAILLAVSCLGLIRRPAGITAAATVLLVSKLFYYFVYVSYYRHELLYVVFLLSLYWMAANGAGGAWRRVRRHDQAELIGTAVLVGILMFQTGALIGPIRAQFDDAPLSRSADVGRLLKQPGLTNAIVMGDPDTMLEPLPYYTGNPLWLLRQQRFGNVVRLTKDARRNISLGDILADAERLNRQTGRPVLFLSQLKLQDRQTSTQAVLFHDKTTMRPEEVRQFWASTRLVAHLRPSESDEDYDVYVYPRSAGR